MTEQLKDYLEQEGMTHDDVINQEIERFQKDVNTLLEEIKTSQQAKETYFTEVLAGKHPGKKLVEQKIVIEFAEVIDYDKSKLVYEETKEDKKANEQYLKNCSIKIDKAALQFANKLQKNERFTIEEFGLFFRGVKTSREPNIEIKGLDMSTGKVKELNDIPPEILKVASESLGKMVKDAGIG